MGASKIRGVCLEKKSPGSGAERDDLCFDGFAFDGFAFDGFAFDGFAFDGFAFDGVASWDEDWLKTAPVYES
jgi:hypothetical protein